MYFKLSLKNVRRSLKDYTIYFLTLTFGICIFYVFNSLDSQQAMLDLTSSQRQMIKLLTTMMGYISVFISIILGFLIIYANKFLIKRRKKELGIYMTLGMNKGGISRVLLYETVSIGFISMAVGLLLGVFLSQAFSIVTANLFEVDLRSYTFAFSGSAFVKSILYFGLIFLCVMLFNWISVSKCKLIDLMTANRKNETLKVRKIWVSVVLFLVSLVLLGAAYAMIIHNGMMMLDAEFTGSLILGSVGTLLFFFSLSGFLVKVVQANKRIYLKNLNMFVLRQLGSKINTTFVSMAVICIMLLVTIGTLSTGMGMSSVMTKDLQQSTPYDASFTLYDRENSKFEKISEGMDKSGFHLADYAAYVDFAYREGNITYSDLVPYNPDSLPEESYERFKDTPVGIISESEYNALMELQGDDSRVSLGENGYAVLVDYDKMIPLIEEFVAKKQSLQVGEIHLAPVYDQPFVKTIVTQSMKGNTGMLVVPDSVAQTVRPTQYILNVQYPYGAENPDAAEDAFFDALNGVYGDDYERMPYDRVDSKMEVYNSAKGLSTTISYIAIYVGIVFLITSAAVLALQQLSESSDNVGRYRLLRKIGVDNKMINRSIFTQIAIYFLMPLALALVHAAVGIQVANKAIEQFGNISALSNILFVAVFLVVVYGGYFLATYFGSKAIVRDGR